MLANLSPLVGFLVHDVARLMRYRFDFRARSLAVTRPQWRALFTIAVNEGMTQAALAERLDVERITLCRMIDRLADAGELLGLAVERELRDRCPSFADAGRGPAVGEHAERVLALELAQVGEQLELAGQLVVPRQGGGHLQR